MKIPFLNLRPQHEEIRTEMLHAFELAYDSNSFILDTRLKDFETTYASFNNVNFAIGVSNGLDALHLSLKALQIGAGDEVIIPAHTYVATALAVSYVGAKPVFAEPDPKTFNVNPDGLERLITSKTKAIIPVHLYGQPCEMDRILMMAKTTGIAVVEDNAQAHGATYNGKMTGSFGIVNGTSFYPGKNLGALGDGGAVTTDFPELNEKIRALRNYGSKVKYYHEEIGFNMRLDEMQAAFLSIKLEYLKKWTEQRQRIADNYTRELVGIGDIVVPYVYKHATHVYHLFVIKTNHRDRLQQYLAEKGIGTMIHYPVPVHLQKAYKYLGHQQGAFPIAEELAGTILSLPIWPGMNNVQIEYVVQCIKNYFKESL